MKKVKSLARKGKAPVKAVRKLRQSRVLPTESADVSLLDEEGPVPPRESVEDPLADWPDVDTELDPPARTPRGHEGDPT